MFAMLPRAVPFRLRNLLLLAFFVALLLLLAVPARAGTGYVMTAVGASSPTQAAAWTGDVIWKAPAAGDYVLSYPSVPAQATSITWGDSNLIYREWTSIPDTYGIQACTVDLASNQVLIAAQGGVDQCAPDADDVKKPFLIKTSVIPAGASSAVGHVFIAWTLPSAGCTTTPCDNVPLTGDLALTAVKVYVSTSPIASDSLMSPTLTLAAGAASTTYSATVTFGTILYVRVKAANANGDSPFSDQVYKAIQIPSGSVNAKPSAPTSVNVTIQFTTQ